jgi:hypothetical protein
MFPVAGDEIYTNEAGEVTGWSKPADPGMYWCDDCGFAHGGPCPPDERDDDEYDEVSDGYDEVSEEEAAYYQEEAERGDLAGSPHTLGCYECRGFDGINFETQEVVALGPVVGSDPTQTYVLKCGHTTI